MNLIKSASRTRGRRNRVERCLHQCKQCGVLFEHVGKAVASAAGFSWDTKFMVAKCYGCKNFRLGAPC